MKEFKNSIDKSKQKTFKILAISSLIGLIAGGVNVLYRLALTQAEHYSFAMYSFISQNSKYIPFLFIALAVVGYGIGCLSAKFPLISGSGIPQVKGRIMGHIKSNWFSTLIFKFIGGTICILSGLSLGREGPSIHLGACVAEGISSKVSASQTEKRIYIASGASAGLAAAFNAPLAGVMFAIEEIFKYFSPMILLTTMISAGIADLISSLVFGTQPVFSFSVTSRIPLTQYWILVVLGIVLGLSGVFYNICLIKSQKLYKKIQNSKLRPIIPMLIAGVLGLTFPIVLCGGHAIIEELSITNTIMFLVVVFTVKFLFSMISFGSGAPGGIFFPLLILGATIGALFAKIAIAGMGLPEELFYNFIILAMAGYFTAIVRAPITGVILLLEMTGSFAQLLPLILTSVVAFVVAEELENKPIYDSLLDGLLENMGLKMKQQEEGKILVEAVVHHGSYMQDKYIKDMNLPQNGLIVAIARGEINITPHGSTQIQAGDYITVLTDLSKEVLVRDTLNELTTAL